MTNKAVFPYLYCFWQVAQRRSFTRAAESLSISQSAVSYQIKQLEDQLRLSLFEREKKSEVRLTSSGKMLADQCQEMFHNLELTLDAMKDKSLSGHVTIAAPTCFGSMILGELVAGLRLQYPELRVHLRLSDLHVDLRSEQIDMAFRTVSPGVDLYTKPLIKIPMRLVANHSYAKKNGLPESLNELHDHTMIMTKPRDKEWSSLREQIPEVPILKDNVTYIDNVWSTLHAIEADLGLSYLPLYTVSNELNRGEFVEVLPDIFNDVYMIIYFSSPYKTTDNPKITAVLNGLKNHLKDHLYSSEIDWLEQQEG